MNLRTEIRNILFISIGAMFLALGIVLFLAPNKIATGGTPGMAILLNYLINIPIGCLLFLINLPLLLVASKMLEKAFISRSVMAILSSSVFIDFCDR